MPAVQSGKILVSGANGYVAVWVITKLLEAGYAVRGTVRSERSIPYLQQHFQSYGDKVEFVIVPDITKVSSSLLQPIDFRMTFAFLVGWRI